MNLIDGLNIMFIRLTDDGLEARMTLSSFHGQPGGYLHGGATIAFGETVAGYASQQQIAPDQAAVGQSVTASHLKAKKIGGYVTARGKLLHKGARFHVWSLEMVDEKQVLLSHMTVTNVIVKGHKAK